MATFAPHVTKRTFYVDVSHKTTLSPHEAFACIVLYMDDTAEGHALLRLDHSDWPDLNQETLRHICKVALFQFGIRRVKSLAHTANRVISPQKVAVDQQYINACNSLRDSTVSHLQLLRSWARQALVFETTTEGK